MRWLAVCRLCAVLSAGFSTQELGVRATVSPPSKQASVVLQSGVLASHEVACGDKRGLELSRIPKAPSLHDTEVPISLGTWNPGVAFSPSLPETLETPAADLRYGMIVRSGRHPGGVTMSHERRKKIMIRRGALFGIPVRIPKDLLASCFGLTGWSNLNLDATGMPREPPIFMADADSQTIPPRSDTKKKILFLMCDTGGGHKASAKAIVGALEELYRPAQVPLCNDSTPVPRFNWYPNRFNCEIVDLWTDYGRFPFNKLVPHYQWAAKNTWSWWPVYYAGEFGFGRWVLANLQYWLCQDKIRAYFKAFDPDMIVSVHPLCQAAPLRILKQMGNGKRRIPFVAVVTDLATGSACWFHREVDTFVVPGDEFEQLALQHGLRPEQIRKLGLPVRKGFWDATERRKNNGAVRARLGLENCPTVMVMGGGDGVGGLQRIAEKVGDELASLGQPVQMTVVCGKNEKVRKALSERAWPDNVKVFVNGFVQNIDEWMIAADCLVSKAGPGSIAEASIAGLPTLVSGFLPGQERGNVQYVIDKGFGEFEKRPDRIASTIVQWMQDPEKMKSMSQMATAAGTMHAGATRQIAREVASYLD